MRKTHFYALFFLVLFSWSVMMLLGPLVGEIAADFGLASETEVGNISATFLLVGGIMSFFWVALEDILSRRYGGSRKKLLIFSTLLWSGGLFLTSIAHNFQELFVFQMITAVGYAAITPLSFSIAMDLTPPKDRAKAFGLLDVASMLGGGLGFMISGLIVGVLPWGVPFVIIATLGLIFMGMLFDLRDPKKGSQEQELTHIIREGVEYEFHISRESLAFTVKKKSNLLILIFSLVVSIASGSITYYFIRMMVSDHGFSSSLAVLFFIATFGSQAVGAIFWTKRADKQFTTKKNGKVRVLLESLLAGPAFQIVAFSLVFTSTEGMLVGLFVAFLTTGVFLLSGIFAISSTIIGEVNPPEMRTSIFSLNNLAQTLGRSIGIFVMGAMFTVFGSVYHWGFAIMGGVYLGAAIFILPLLKFIPRELSQLSALLRRRAQTLENQSSES